MSQTKSITDASSLFTKQFSCFHRILIAIFDIFMRYFSEISMGAVFETEHLTISQRSIVREGLSESDET
jgi:hypothetical protein